MKDTIHSIQQMLYDQNRNPTATGWSVLSALVLPGIVKPIFDVALKNHATTSAFVLAGASVVALTAFALARPRTPVVLASPAERKGHWGFESVTEIRSTCKILIIDDRVLPHQELLERRGYKITKIDRVPQRSTPIESEYDLLLLDHKGVTDSYTATDGMAALKTIRRDNPWLPILVLTSFESDERIRDNAKLHDGVIGKDKEFSEIERLLLDTLDRSARKEFFAERLKQYDVKNGPEMLGAIEASGVDIEPILDAPTASAVGSARSIRDLARSIYSRIRWRTEP